MREIAEATGISNTECHRYVVPEAYEAFSVKQVENMRRYRPSMYLQVIGSARPLPDGRIMLNRSKHAMLVHYAHRNGYRIHPNKRFAAGFVVERVRIDGLFDDQRNSDHPDLVTTRSHTAC